LRYALFITTLHGNERTFQMVPCEQGSRFLEQVSRPDARCSTYARLLRIAASRVGLGVTGLCASRSLAGREALAWSPATTAMTHIAIQEQLDGKAVDWMEHVTDEQYGCRSVTLLTTARLVQWETYF
jgi:hypothetical protein